jgi:hypothetical protein
MAARARATRSMDQMSDILGMLTVARQMPTRVDFVNRMPKEVASLRTHVSALRSRENVRGRRDETTVGRQRSAGEPACFVGCEKRDDVGDVLRLPETA